MTVAAAPRAAFRYRDFRLSLGAGVVSVFAMQMQSVAIGWQVYDLTHRPFDLGLVGLAQFVPAISLSLVSGQTADRYDRRGILRICQLGQALCSLLLCVQASYGLPSPAPIYAILVLMGVARAFSAPASQALLPIWFRLSTSPMRSPGATRFAKSRRWSARPSAG